MVIALDSYDGNGAPDKKMLQVVQEIFKAVRLDAHMEKLTGFALSTAMPVFETIEFLKSGKIRANDFDALICCSGSEVYYPGLYTEEDGKLCPDTDYASHIDYRWGCDGLKKTIWQLMNTQDGSRGDASNQSEGPIVEDLNSSNPHCVSYFIKDSSKATKVDDLRQKLRMRGLRCHPMYCRTSTRMQVIPLLASRAQALRYLFVRWRLNVRQYVRSEDLIRTSGSYVRDDIVPKESPFVAYTSGDAKAGLIADALKQRIFVKLGDLDLLFKDLLDYHLVVKHKLA
ncbi:hypothetical protein Nepgr_022122 [Nepenthes gracilis]|uniref:Sucrose phosphatase-like domain-containing protein n=1 Tax=Nepenthes gracilis TaxID=150966 RepID=A0AAD3XY29_NEPGR|nr:hypothetical protein Nepgr_022122 [Nepenthes gracilis]